MGRVFYTDLPAHLRFTLLALADHANDDGDNVYPGQERLARKVGAAVRTVRDQVHELERLGYLVAVGRQGQHGTTRYRIAVEKLPTIDALDRQPTADRQELPTGSPPPSVASRPAAHRRLDRQPTADKPSGTIKKKQPSGRDTPTRKARLPDDFTLTEERRAYAVGKGCQNPSRTFEAFVTFYRGSGKSQLDWDATFRTWVLGAHGGPDWKACGCGGAPADKPRPVTYAAGGVRVLSYEESLARRRAEGRA